MALTLLFLTVVAVIARVTVFAEGGTAGAWACSILFLGCAVGASGVWLKSFLDRSSATDVRGGFGILCLGAILVIGITDNTDIVSLALLTFLASLIALIVVSARRWFVGRRDLRAPPATGGR